MHPTTTELAFMNIPHNIIDDRAMSRSDPTAKLLLWSMSLMTTDTMFFSMHPNILSSCSRTGVPQLLSLHSEEFVPLLLTQHSRENVLQLLSLHFNTYMPFYMHQSSSFLDTYLTSTQSVS